MTEKQVVEYGIKDYIQLSFWYIILYAMVCWQGWIIGLVLYTIFLYAVAYVLQNHMNLEMMSGPDEIFFLDDHRNCLNIVAFHKWDKITDVDSFRKTMLSRGC